MTVVPERSSESELELSIVVPARNEAQFIGACLDSIVTNGFEHQRMEVLVIDGMSTDGTGAIVRGWNARYPWIHIVPNPSKTTSVAFNIGIRMARGRLVTLMSAHAIYEKGSLLALVEAARKYTADNVGGLLRLTSRTDGVWARAIVAVLSHPFGVGGSRFRHSERDVIEAVSVDTVAFGCYRREVFDRIGLFNEDLVHSQDIELNRRLLRAGGRILLAAGVSYRYFARTGPSEFVGHSFRNGLWAMKPFAYASGMPVAPRHLVPGAFVMGVLGVCMIGTLAQPLFMIGSLAIFVPYVLLALVSACHLAVTRRDPWLLATTPIAFLSLHASYGIGSVVGLLWLIVKAGRGKLSVFREAWSTNPKKGRRPAALP